VRGVFSHGSLRKASWDGGLVTGVVNDPGIADVIDKILSSIYEFSPTRGDISVLSDHLSGYA
jgi:hypothetical protein